MTRSLVDLAVSDILDGIEITIDTQKLQPRLVREGTRTTGKKSPDPVYLIVRQEASIDDPDTQLLQASLLTSGGKATVVSETQEYSLKSLDQLLSKIGSSSFSADSLNKLGDEVTQMVLPRTIQQILLRMKGDDSPLVVLHDDESSRIPWEVLRIPDEQENTPFVPALKGGLSRRLMTDVSIAKWMESRREEKTLEMLLVIDPTSDLPGAVHEGDRIIAQLSGNPKIRITEIRQEEAQHGRLLAEMRSGKYDIVHYAGHAFFDPVNRSRSGLICSDNRVLSGADLAGIGQLPTLMVFNACEAGRIRGAAPGHADKHTPQSGVERVLRNVSLSEAFLRGGVANYIGTYWPVGDNPAAEFADSFYSKLLAGATLGEAITAGRHAIHKIDSKDWADYMHYGNVSFSLKD